MTESLTNVLLLAFTSTYLKNIGHALYTYFNVIVFYCLHERSVWVCVCVCMGEGKGGGVGGDCDKGIILSIIIA